MRRVIVRHSVHGAVDRSVQVRCPFGQNDTSARGRPTAIQTSVSFDPRFTSGFLDPCVIGVPKGSLRCRGTYRCLIGCRVPTCESARTVPPALTAKPHGLDHATGARAPTATIASFVEVSSTVRSRALRTVGDPVQPEDLQGRHGQPSMIAANTPTIASIADLVGLAWRRHNRWFSMPGRSLHVSHHIHRGGIHGTS